MKATFFSVHMNIHLTNDFLFVNMLSSEILSPLSKIKRTIFILRLLIGFPLKSHNEDFNILTFNPWMEYPKYALYSMIFLVPHIYYLYVFSTIDSNKNVFETYITYMAETLGYSMLDTMIVTWIPLVCFTSTTFYMISFQKQAEGISKVCLEMSNVKEAVGELTLKLREPKPKSKMTFSDTMLLSMVSLSLLILILFIFSTFQSMDEFLSNYLSSSNNQLLLLKLNIVIYSCCWVYPTISMSADILTCHILEEMGDLYLGWNKALAFNNKFCNELELSAEHLSLPAQNFERKR